MKRTQMLRGAMIAALAACFLSAGLVIAELASPFGPDSVSADGTAGCAGCMFEANACINRADARLAAARQDCAALHAPGSPGLSECDAAARAANEAEVQSCNRQQAVCFATCGF